MMARHRKSVQEHRMNGNPSRLTLPEVSLEGSHLPVGEPPKGMPAGEKVIWRRLIKELPFLNVTNRAYLELAVQAASRYYRLNKYFESRRAKAKKQKEPEVYDELNDARTRSHPLLASFKDARAEYKSMLSELGATPSVQARLLEYIDNSMRNRAKAEREAEEGYLT